MYYLFGDTGLTIFYIGLSLIPESEGFLELCYYKYCTALSCCHPVSFLMLGTITLSLLLHYLNTSAIASAFYLSNRPIGGFISELFADGNRSAAFKTDSLLYISSNLRLLYLFAPVF